MRVLRSADRLTLWCDLVKKRDEERMSILFRKSPSSSEEVNLIPPAERGSSTEEGGSKRESKEDAKANLSHHYEELIQGNNAEISREENSERFAEKSRKSEGKPPIH